MRVAPRCGVGSGRESEGKLPRRGSGVRLVPWLGVAEHAAVMDVSGIGLARLLHCPHCSSLRAAYGLGGSGLHAPERNFVEECSQVPQLPPERCTASARSGCGRREGAIFAANREGVIEIVV